MRFTLVNPLVSGSLNTSVSTQKDIVAAKKLYDRLSQYFTNNLPSFFFTLKGEDGQLHHFETNERKTGRNISYTIRKVSMSEDGEKRLGEILTQKGGKKKKRSDSDSDSDSDSSSSSFKKSRYYLLPFESYLYYGNNYLLDYLYPVQQYYLPVFTDYLNSVVHPVYMV